MRQNTTHDITRKPAPLAWLWLSLLTVLLWGAWGLQSKIIVDRISPWMNQVLFPLGLLPISAALLGSRRARGGNSPVRGSAYALLTGVLGGVGNITFYLALAMGGQASTVVPLAGLAPLVTVVLAYVVLHEVLTRMQMAGVACAMVSIYLLSV